MGYPDIIHLLRAPHWWIWILTEGGLILLAFGASKAFPTAGPPIAVALDFLAFLIFVVLSLGLAFSPSFQKALIRPNALFETRHRVFLVLGAIPALVVVIGLAVALLLLLVGTI